MENAYVEQFLSEYYEKETKEYIQATMVDISAHMEQIREDTLKGVDDFFLMIAKKQKEDPTPITYINLSFLYTSVYFEKPIFRLDAYDNAWYWGTCFCSSTLSADWLYTKWEAYQNRLREYIKEKGFERYIREEKLKQIVHQTMKTLVYQGMAILKYILCDCGETEHYSEFLKSETLCLTYGEYKDWQRCMFADTPKIDILLSKPDVTRKFQVCENQEFSKVVFKDMDFSNSKFIHCTFKNCEFEQLIMNDCVFETCTFEQVEMKDIPFYGATFYDCKIMGFKGDGLAFGLISRPDSKDLYKMADMISCIFEDIKISSSDLSEINFDDCTGTRLELMECNTSKSNLDWAKEGEKG